MKVKELIAQLKKLDPEAVVMVKATHYEYFDQYISFPSTFNVFPEYALPGDLLGESFCPKRPGGTVYESMKPAVQLCRYEDGSA